MTGRLTDAERAAAGLAAPFCTGVVDLHHHDGTFDLVAARAAGLVALVHKATEGKDFRDKGFVGAVDAARAAGLEVGAYHFASASAPGQAQADFFLATVGTRAALLALDFERNPGSAGTMKLTEAAAFVRRVHERTGRWPLFYAGLSHLSGEVARASADVLATLAHCPLWLAAYGPNPLRLVPPRPWERWSLQQYTNGAAGPADRDRFPRSTPGFTRAAQDRSVFRGTPDELRAWWQTCGRAP